ncbi:hypothetical protein AB0G85_36435 [Streptomyces sioyaensis]|uniref:hypothetical protein n=1 Tax=Streptomyces sioyaensis TaxID=67364 RepID=UPI0033F2F4FA
MHVLLAALTAALLAIHLFTPSTPAVEAYAAEPIAAVALATPRGDSAQPELCGHFWNRGRQQAEDLLAAAAAHGTALNAAVPATAGSACSRAAPYDEPRTWGDRSSAVLQVFRC